MLRTEPIAWVLSPPCFSALLAADSKTQAGASRWRNWGHVLCRRCRKQTGSIWLSSFLAEGQNPAFPETHTTAVSPNMFWWPWSTNHPLQMVSQKEKTNRQKKKRHGQDGLCHHKAYRLPRKRIIELNNQARNTIPAMTSPVKERNDMPQGTWC